MSESIAPVSVRPDFMQRSMWEVTWPLLLSFALSLSLHFVDSFFLSRVSDQAAGAVGALFPLFGAVIVVFSAVGQAGGSVASQLIGARRNDEVPVAYLSLVAFNLAIGVIASAAAILFHREVPALLGLSGPGAEHARGYLALLGGCQFLKAVQVAYANILTSRGDTRWVMAEAFTTNVCNLVLNMIFLHGTFGVPRLGVQGVALATVLSLLAGLTFTMAVVHLRFGLKLPLRTPLGVVWARLKSILNIGLPSALEPISYQCMQVFVNSLIISWGAAALAARVYVLNFMMITTILWGLAFGIGTQVMVAHRIGARRFDDASSQLHRGLRFGVFGNLAISGLLALFHRQLLGLLTDDPTVHALATPLFLLGMLVEPARAANIVIGGALRSSGDARYPAAVGIAFMWGFAVPACYVFGRVLGLGLTGIWLAFAIDETVRGVINHKRWKIGRWKERGVLSRRGSSLPPPETPSEAASLAMAGPESAPRVEPKLP